MALPCAAAQPLLCIGEWAGRICLALLFLTLTVYYVFVHLSPTEDALPCNARPVCWQAETLTMDPANAAVRTAFSAVSLLFFAYLFVRADTFGKHWHDWLPEYLILFYQVHGFIHNYIRGTGWCDTGTNSLFLAWPQSGSLVAKATLFALISCRGDRVVSADHAVAFSVLWWIFLLAVGFFSLWAADNMCTAEEEVSAHRLGSISTAFDLSTVSQLGYLGVYLVYRKIRQGRTLPWPSLRPLLLAHFFALISSTTWWEILHNWAVTLCIVCHGLAALSLSELVFKSQVLPPTSLEQQYLDSLNVRCRKRALFIGISKYTMLKSLDGGKGDDLDGGKGDDPVGKDRTSFETVFRNLGYSVCVLGRQGQLSLRDLKDGVRKFMEAVEKDAADCRDDETITNVVGASCHGVQGFFSPHGDVELLASDASSWWWQRGMSVQWITQQLENIHPRGLGPANTLLIWDCCRSGRPWGNSPIGPAARGPSRTRGSGSPTVTIATPSCRNNTYSIYACLSGREAFQNVFGGALMCEVLVKIGEEAKKKPIFTILDEVAMYINSRPGTKQAPKVDYHHHHYAYLVDNPTPEEPPVIVYGVPVRSLDS